MSDAKLVWDCKCDVGESCVWDAVNRRILFTDLHTGRILACGVDGGTKTIWQVADFVGSFGMCRSGRLVIGLRRKVALYDPRSGVLQDLAEIPEPEQFRLNDGKVGPDGCFWVGSTNSHTDKKHEGSLYRVSPEGKVELKSQGYLTTNGLAWTPDGKTMFHTDSRRGAIDAWDFDAANGGISNRRRIATLVEEDGRPDGGAADAEGCYWSAGVSAGCINRFSPTGKLLEKFPVQVAAPTMPAFAGKTLFITSLRRGKDEATLARTPASGGLLRLDVTVAGAEVGLFADT